MKKEKSIETPELLIKGNIMSWEGMMIQLSNVSCISTAPLELMGFPIGSIVLLFIGIFILEYNAALGMVLVIGGAAWVYGWYYINNKRKLDTVLNIAMNSGNNFMFIIRNKDFLSKVLHVLEQIIIKGNIGKQDVVINIQGNKISGSPNILNDLNL